MRYRVAVKKSKDNINSNDTYTHLLFLGGTGPKRFSPLVPGNNNISNSIIGVAMGTKKINIHHPVALKSFNLRVQKITPITETIIVTKIMNRLSALCHSG
ncbi:Putative uncharacterized protein [Halomonas sp. R57-5]|nr:Putative uncharacterized protein [Halomonas sp. R57-5]